MSLGVVSIPYFESWLALHNDAKLNWHFLTVSLEKRDFFCKQHQTWTYFMPLESIFAMIRIRDRYLKIRLHLARIN